MYLLHSSVSLNAMKSGVQHAHISCPSSRHLCLNAMKSGVQRAPSHQSNSAPSICLNAMKSGVQPALLCSCEFARSGFECDEERSATQLKEVVRNE